MLLVLTWLVPLLAAGLAPFPRFWWLPAIAALPALATVVLVPPGSQLEISWLLLGSVLGLDWIGRIFLGFTAILWLAAGLHAAGSMKSSPHAGRFRTFFLLAMAGNLWLIVGKDLASFYTGFSLMGLAAYGLVIHNQDRFALRAGKVYLVMTVLGELALFVALVLIAYQTDTLAPDTADLVGLSDLTVGLLLAGLAIKAGLVPVHVWLPLAHPAAPVPASAVLSGAMIKVALLGWLRFLPIGEVPMTEWGLLLIVAGLLTLFYALPIGLVQSNAKVILAYSSVSKMGLMSLTLGLILLEPDLAGPGVLALSLYAAHHALAKGGLFLGVGLRHDARAQGLVLAGIALLALSLAAVPFSGGAVAKYGIKPMLAETDWSWLVTAVAVTTVGTALLMARFFSVIKGMEPHPSPGQALGGAGWAGLLVLILLYPLLLGKPNAWATNALPTLFALAMVLPFALTARRRPELLRPSADLVPAGDLLGLARYPIGVLGFSGRSLSRWWDRVLRSGSARWDAAVATIGPPPQDPERVLRRWPNAGAAWLAVTALLLLLPLSTLMVLRPMETPRVTSKAPESTPSASAPQARLAVVDREHSATSEPQVTSSERQDAIPRKPEPISPAASDAPAAEPIPGELPAEQPLPETSTTLEQAPVAMKTEESAPAPISSPASEPGRLASEPVASPESMSSEATSPPAEASLEVRRPEPETRETAQVDVEVGIKEAKDRSEEAKAPIDPAQERKVPEIAQEKVACDPGRTFVFSHPLAVEVLTLRDCVQGPDGPERVIAPTLTSALVGLVQRHLGDLGFDPGPIDGLMGPRTRDAIGRFQRDQGDPATGFVTFALLERMRAAAAANGDDSPTESRSE